MNDPSDHSTVGRQQAPHTEGSVSVFHNAQIGRDMNGQINTAGGNLIVNNNTTTNNDLVTTVLWPRVAAGAIFDSAVRQDAGKCHPGTRERIIERILDWIKNPDPNKDISWLYGAAGAGKSAVAHTICELLKELHPDEYGASFFFSAGSTDCGDASKLFATLAYQLSMHFPPIRAEINAALASDPSLPTKSMEIQMLRLIVQPLQRCRTLLSHDPVLIIDGLDECADDNRGTTQANIIALVAKCIHEYNIPLRFMISSRPEYWIRDIFATAPLPGITQPLSLRDDVDADEDIKAYLTEGFEKIRLENKHFMKSVASPWPPEDIVNGFVEEASGQYIYPATVLRFVGNYSKFTNPQKQLAIITSPGPHRAVAFSQLDRLYATIVSVYPEWHSMKRVLAALLLGANTTIIKVVLGVDPEELDVVLDALSSLVEKKKKKEPLSDDDLKEEELLESIMGSLREEGAMSFCHLSFQEFLQNKDRSGPFHIDLKSDEVPVDIVKGYFGMIQRNFDQHYETQPHIFLNIELETYHHAFQDTMWESTTLCHIDTLLPLMTRITAELEHYDPGWLTHMHSVFYFAYDIGYLSIVMWATKFHKDESGPSTELQTTYEKFRQAINLAHERALSSLPSCTDFNPTPTLVYLTDYHKAPFNTYELPITELGTIAGVVDVISTLRQHHYLLPLSWSSAHEAVKFYTMQSVFTQNPGPGSWRTQGTWRDLLRSFVLRSLKYIFTKRESDTNSDWDDRTHYVRLSYQFSALEKFFNWQSISDICDKGYFRSTYNQTILAPMADMDAWVGLLSRLGSDHHYLSPRTSFISSVLCWINRQLTNPHTLMLLEEYDKTLEQKLATVLRYLFYDSFLKDFIKDSRKSFLTFRFRCPGENNSKRSTTMKVRPLPHGFYEEKDEDKWKEVDFERFPRYWQAFHNEIFGKPARSIEASINSIILPTDWHPHLGALLLEVLVRFLYGKFHEESSDGPFYAYEESFPYLISCLPYIHPTARTLDALRAIVYLYPKVTPAWDPPDQFWPLLLGFIQKYDRSILSSEELELFTTWLNSTEHAEITTYISETRDTAPSIVAPENATASGGTSHDVDSAANITNPTQPIQGALLTVTPLDQSWTAVDAPQTLRDQKRRTADVGTGRECSECGLAVDYVQHPEQSIQCGNPGCEIHWFHRACWTIEGPEWFCEECERGRKKIKKA